MEKAVGSYFFVVFPRFSAINRHVFIVNPDHFILQPNKSFFISKSINHSLNCKLVDAIGTVNHFIVN